MPTTTTGSFDISVLDDKIVADLCAGKFYIDLSPSAFIANGADYVEGASIKITNPVGTVIRNYISSGYDIYPPMTSVFEYAIPLVAGNYLYGTYIIDVKLTDQSGNEYVVSKSVNICIPDKLNKTKKEGCLNASITGNCDDGKVLIVLDQVPTYKGKTSSSQVNTLTVEYPTGSEVDPLDTTFSSFSVQLYEGVYKVTGSVCALYFYGDSVYFEVKYKVKCEKNIRCEIDRACIFAAFQALNAQVDTDCSDEEKNKTASKILDALRLLESIDMAVAAGQDPSDYINSLEELLQCKCTCNCNDGTPVINNNPVTDYRVEGCSVEETVVSGTKVFTVSSMDHLIELADPENTELITIGDVVEEDCVRKQTITVNASVLGTSKVYKAVLNQSGTAAPTKVVNRNTTGGTIAFTRIGLSQYRATATGFTFDNTTMIYIGPSTKVLPINCYVSSPTTIEIEVDSLTESVIVNMSFFLEMFHY